MEPSIGRIFLALTALLGVAPEVANALPAMAPKQECQMERRRQEKLQWAGLAVQLFTEVLRDEDGLPPPPAPPSLQRPGACTRCTGASCKNHPQVHAPSLPPIVCRPPSLEKPIALVVLGGFPLTQDEAEPGSWMGKAIQGVNRFYDWLDRLLGKVSLREKQQMRVDAWWEARRDFENRGYQVIPYDCTRFMNCTVNGVEYSVEEEERLMFLAEIKGQLQDPRVKAFCFVDDGGDKQGNSTDDPKLYICNEWLPASEVNRLRGLNRTEVVIIHDSDEGNPHNARAWRNAFNNWGGFFHNWENGADAREFLPWQRKWK